MFAFALGGNDDRGGGVRRHHNNNTAQQQECCEKGAATYVPEVVDVREGKREIGDGEGKTVATAA